MKEFITHKKVIKENKEAEHSVFYSADSADPPPLTCCQRWRFVIMESCFAPLASKVDCGRIMFLSSGVYSSKPGIQTEIPTKAMAFLKSFPGRERGKGLK